MPTKLEYHALLQRTGNKFVPKDFCIQQGTSVTDIDYGFLKSFLKWRLWAAGRYMMITSAYRKNDPRAHGHGLALDVILFDNWLRTPTAPMEQWLLATTWPFRGVGIYFDWNYTDKDGVWQPAVGLHVDNHFEGRPLRWLRRTEKYMDGTEEKTRRLYYYQDTKTGLFYNKDTQKTVSLTDAISEWEAAA